MGFITTAIDVRKLALNIDRKPALPDKNPRASIVGAERSKLSDLDDYIKENIFFPIITDDSIPVGRLDFERITDDDIATLIDVFEGIDTGLLNFCAVFDSFPASPAAGKIII